MAKRPTEVSLSLDDCEPNALPPVCCKCGAAATCEKEVKFTWTPPWVIFTIFVGLIWPFIIGMIVRKRRAANMPVCDRHNGVWNWGNGLAYFILFSSLLLEVATLAAFDGNKVFPGVVPVLTLGIAAYFLVGLVVAVVVQGRGPQVTLISDDEIKFKKLAPAFVEVLEEQQDAEEAEYQAKKAAKRAVRGTA